MIKGVFGQTFGNMLVVQTFSGSEMDSSDDYPEPPAAVRFGKFSSF